MENNETSKDRRLSGTPTITASNADAIKAPRPVSPATFYGSSSAKNPPPLPSRPKNVGSSHTKLSAPATPPPNYHALDASPFREPQLVEEGPIEQDREIISTDDGQNSGWGYNPTENWGGDGWNSNWTNGYDAGNQGDLSGTKLVNIDGRSTEEEDNWWDTSVREKNKRPGPGMLPSLLAEMLHNTDHSLFSVSTSSPDLKSPPPSQPSQSSQTADETPSAANPPTADDLTHAIPHANAYYCRKHNGWVFLQWKSSSILPPIARSFHPDPLHPLPDQISRKRTSSCVGNAEQPFGAVNKTHHFHRYEKAVDARQLNPPFVRAEWELTAQTKLKRRRVTSLDMGEIDVLSAAATEDKMVEDLAEDEEGDLFDLYVCCQCSVYCIASDVISGVIPVKYVEDFTRERQNNPPPGKSGEESVMAGWETMVSIVQKKLWQGENRSLTIKGKAFSTKIGWNTTVRTIFEEFLGFSLLSILSPNGTEEQSMSPPDTDPDTPQGRQMRTKWLRFWVEVSAWLVDYQRRFPQSLKQYAPQQLWVKIDNAREMYQMAIGAHPDQIPRGSASHSLQTYQPIHTAWKALGLTPSTYTWELLAFGYMAQCRCDPIHTSEYFTHFYKIVKAMQDLGDVPPQELQNIVLEERTRGRFTDEDLVNASRALGFGHDGPLSVEFEDDVPDQFIVDAWRDTVRRAWRDPQDGSQRQRDANDGFRIIAESKGNAQLRKLWEDSSKSQMDPSRAYSLLEIPQETDDEMLLTVFGMRVEEQPSQLDKMREALTTIAEVRDSARLRRFLETGVDPGDVVQPTRADLPRGLNQLGNTCYLNSLLQYFYTIKGLRDAVAPMANTDMKTLEDEKFSDDDLKRHRVGGRLVTRREILRSKKFVSQLADLFWQMEFCETAAITPTMDLAKLALVTSRDEEDEEADKGGTDSSNDTDATLVEDGSVRVTQSDSANTVLGKRPRDESKSNEMDVDSPMSEIEKNGFVIVSKPSSPRRSKSPRINADSSGSGSNILDITKDVEMQDVTHITTDHTKKTPPTQKTTVSSDSVMMFGKQHDVSECMDNCMFQIEIALLKFDEMSMLEGKDSSVVKRLFYGKLRQRLTSIASENRPRVSVHEKEDLFSNLPINVAENGFDIYDGLSGYFDDVVEYEGTKAKMEVALVDLPPLLQIQLQRVQFNRETLQPYKSQAYVKFGETIFMDRFLDSANPQKKLKSKALQTELNGRRERLRLLTQDKHAPFTDALDHTLGFLAKQEGVALSEVDQDLIVHFNGEQDLVKAEIEKLRDEITKLKQGLETIWQDDQNIPYELTSVFIHRGSSPSWGHYFFYSRHLPENPDAWFKYNDSEVSEVSKSDVLADTTGSTANPYLLVFARKGTDIVQTVKRFDPMSLEEADA
ncbi:hypothetical protein BJ138DRAFT_1139617 [Hygrophoropsis aurantiaca]|uniref:Uncharacterized protein n=1 Tax=Hygrophoropsis aurantiaca TaxID=72124 RepID=A0ACB8AST4_9AGAM|nr:hypothetical protein BJ138DRAFT_1139617 [Hygrophoropsis aurantiaca]